MTGARTMTAGIGLILAVMGAAAARAVDLRLPFNPREIAADAGRAALPDGVSVTSELDALKISAPSGVRLTEAVTLEQTVDIPPQVSGREVELRMKVSGRALAFGGGGGPGLAVRIAGKAVPLPRGDFHDRIVGVKVRCPANGKLPIVIEVRNFSGTLWLKEPKARIDVPSGVPKSLKRRRR